MAKVGKLTRANMPLTLSWLKFLQWLVLFRYKIKSKIPLYFSIKSRIFSRPHRISSLSRSAKAVLGKKAELWDMRALSDDSSLPFRRLIGSPSYSSCSEYRTTQLGSFSKHQDDPTLARCWGRCTGRGSTTKWLCWHSKSPAPRRLRTCDS